MKKFLATYLAPGPVIDEWKKTEPEKRRQGEEKMQGEWKKWMSDHIKMFADTGAGVGKTKRVTGQGTADTRNDIMLYAVVEAESHEAAARTKHVMQKHPKCRETHGENAQGRLGLETKFAQHGTRPDASSRAICPTVHHPLKPVVTLTLPPLCTGSSNANSPLSKAIGEGGQP